MAEELEAVCKRTYFCEKLGGAVRFKRGDRVRYRVFSHFVIIDGCLDVFRSQFERHFIDVADMREERINEILDDETQKDKVHGRYGEGDPGFP